MRRSGKRKLRPGVPGRPRRPAEKVRSKRLRVRFSDRELALLRERTGELPIPELMREMLLKKYQARRAGRIPRTNHETSNQVGKLGNNVNQLIDLARQGRLPAHLEPLLRQLYEELARYERDLVRGPQ